MDFEKWTPQQIGILLVACMVWLFIGRWTVGTPERAPLMGVQRPDFNEPPMTPPAMMPSPFQNYHGVPVFGTAERLAGGTTIIRFRPFNDGDRWDRGLFGDALAPDEMERRFGTSVPQKKDAE